MYGNAQTPGCRRLKLEVKARLHAWIKHAPRASDSRNVDHTPRYLEPAQVVLQELELRPP